jgi:hypothetical protein
MISIVGETINFYIGRCKNFLKVCTGIIKITNGFDDNPRLVSDILSQDVSELTTKLEVNHNFST